MCARLSDFAVNILRLVTLLTMVALIVVGGFKTFKNYQENRHLNITLHKYRRIQFLGSACFPYLYIEFSRFE